MTNSEMLQRVQEVYEHLPWVPHELRSDQILSRVGPGPGHLTVLIVKCYQNLASIEVSPPGGVTFPRHNYGLDRTVIESMVKRVNQMNANGELERLHKDCGEELQENLRKLLAPYISK